LFIFPVERAARDVVVFTKAALGSVQFRFNYRAHRDRLCCALNVSDFH
jgi:hypothetical protein